MRHSVALDISKHLLDRWIDSHDFVDSGSLRRDATKANRIQLEGGGHGRLALLSNFEVRAVVH